jgi:hypothetical protein
VLQPGGAIFLTTPNLASAVRLATGRRWYGYSDPTHLHLFTPAALRWLVSQSGFEVATLTTPYLPLRRASWLPRALVTVAEATVTGGQIVMVARRL